VDIFRCNNFVDTTRAMNIKGYKGLKRVIKDNEGERIYD
jgi:hypothetical protein